MEHYFYLLQLQKKKENGKEKEATRNVPTI